MTIDKRDIINELRRVAMELECGEQLCPPGDSAGLPDDVLDVLADRFGLAVDDEPAGPVDPTAINGIEGFSIVDALEAFVQAGVCRVEVHPAFWEQWEYLLKTFRVERAFPDAFSPCIHMEEGALSTKRTLVARWEPCNDMLCAPCKYLAHQWAHRMPVPPTPKTPNPEAN